MNYKHTILSTAFVTAVFASVSCNTSSFKGASGGSKRNTSTTTPTTPGEPTTPSTPSTPSTPGTTPGTGTTPTNPGVPRVDNPQPPTNPDVKRNIDFSLGFGRVWPLGNGLHADTTCQLGVTVVDALTAIKQAYFYNFEVVEDGTRINSVIIKHCGVNGPETFFNGINEVKLLNSSNQTVGPVGKRLVEDTSFLKLLLMRGQTVFSNSDNILLNRGTYRIQVMSGVESSTNPERDDFYIKELAIEASKGIRKGSVTEQ